MMNRFFGSVYKFFGISLLCLIIVVSSVICVFAEDTTQPTTEQPTTQQQVVVPTQAEQPTTVPTGSEDNNSNVDFSVIVIGIGCICGLMLGKAFSFWKW